MVTPLPSPSIYQLLPDITARSPPPPAVSASGRFGVPSSGILGTSNSPSSPSSSQSSPKSCRHSLSSSLLLLPTRAGVLACVGVLADEEGAAAVAATPNTAEGRGLPPLLSLPRERVGCPGAAAAAVGEVEGLPEPGFTLP